MVRQGNGCCAWDSPPRCPGRIEAMSPDQARVTSPPSGGAFGPNAWLVDDMFEEYRNDPSSVSESWREFFADYVPGGVATAALPPSPVVAPPPVVRSPAVA